MDTIRGCAPSPDTGDNTTTGEAYITGVIQGCGLTPSDLYMVDFPEFLRTQSLKGKTSTEVKNMLAGYRAQKGDSLLFLEYNPSLGQPEVGYDAAHLVYLSLYPQDPEGAKVYHPDDIFVDLHTMTVRSIKQGFLLADLNAADPHPLTPLQKDELTTLLNNLVANWDPTYPESWNKGTQTTGYEGWLLAVCLDDDSLYSFGSMGELDNLPPDFQEFVDSFLQITGVTW